MIYSEGDFLTGSLSWGWTCKCGQEDSGYDSATAARESEDNHKTHCRDSVQPEGDSNG